MVPTVSLFETRLSVAASYASQLVVMSFSKSLTPGTVNALTKRKVPCTKCKMHAPRFHLYRVSSVMVGMLAIICSTC